MTGTDKKLQELRTVLGSNNTLKISHAIRAMRSEPPYAGAIAMLISYFDSSANNPVKQLIREFMNDLKNKASCAEVVDEIRKDHKAGTLEMLASSCWQSGLDYSGFCEDFADLFLAGDYMTALECFTVLEASVENISRQKKDAMIRKLKDEMSVLKGEKTALTSELISLLG